MTPRHETLTAGRPATAIGWPRARRPLRLAIAGLVALVVMAMLAVALGSVTVAPGDTLAILVSRLLPFDIARTWSPVAETIVWDLRLPRVLEAGTVGLGLAVAGATFQGLLRNPLADPYVLGTASGAALGAAIAVLIPIRIEILAFGLLQVLAFVGALGAVTLVYRLSRTTGGSPLTSLLLTGYALGSLMAAALAMAMYLSGAALRQIFSYLLGSFGDASWAELGGAVPIVGIATALILVRARSLNGLLLGDEAAAHLGVDVRRERAILLALASLITAAAVSVSGLVGFVGLVVPHVVRLLVGPNARLVLPLSAIGGAILMIAADLVARLLGELPVGVITAVVGAPFFLFLLRRAQRGYEV
jgi:iron complex transport system permease protein